MNSGPGVNTARCTLLLLLVGVGSAFHRGGIWLVDLGATSRLHEMGFMRGIRRCQAQDRGSAVGRSRGRGHVKPPPPKKKWAAFLKGAGA